MIGGKGTVSRRCSAGAVATILLLGAACGEAGSESSAPGSLSGRRFDALTLRAGESSVPRETIRSVRRLTPSPEGAWEDGEFPGKGSIERESKGEDSPWVYRMSDSKIHECIVREGLDLEEVNSIIVLATVDVEYSISLELEGGPPGSDFRSHVTVHPGPAPQPLQFDIFTDPERAKIRRKNNAEGLKLRARGVQGSVTLHSMEFVYRPPSLTLPSPEDGGDLIECGTDFRWGVAIQPGETVNTTGSVGPGAELMFSYSLLEVHKKEDLLPTLDLELVGSSGTREFHSFSLEYGSDERWSEVRLSLEDFAGQEVDMAWELGDGVRSIAAIAEVGLLAGEGHAARVVLITSDTHRADHLGAADLGIDVRTPALDALAARGVTFENCFASTNVTNPSHIGLMTGTHPRDTGVLHNRVPVNRSALTLAERYRDAGYATFASLSARHLGDPYSGLGQGFQRIQQPLETSSIPAEISMAPVLEWLDRSPDVPVFLWLHVYDAHTPYEPPPEITQSYYPSIRAAYDESLPPLEGPDQRAHKKFPGLRDLELPRALYRAEVTSLDWELGRLLDRADLQDALIAFTADHGEALGEHGVFYAHSGLYPNTLHVPLILSYPNAPGGSRESVPVSQLDLGRTLLDLSGLSDSEFPGRNLLTVDSGEAGVPRFAIGASAQLASVTIDDWHLVMQLNGPKSKRGDGKANPKRLHGVALFDLGSDPGAKRNLVSEHLARAKSMREALITWLLESQDRGWRGAEISDKKSLRELAALGYTTSQSTEERGREFFPANCNCGECENFGE